MFQLVYQCLEQSSSLPNGKMNRSTSQRGSMTLLVPVDVWMCRSTLRWQVPSQESAH